MHYALKDYLLTQGYTNIFCDYMPDVSVCLGAIDLSKWNHTVGSINDGSGMHYIQIQVRSATAEQAYKTCSEIFALLDSGTEEKLIRLNENIHCIARPRRGAIILERGEGYTTYYCEIALWGEN